MRLRRLLQFLIVAGILCQFQAFSRQHPSPSRRSESFLVSSRDTVFRLADRYIRADRSVVRTPAGRQLLAGAEYSLDPRTATLTVFASYVAEVRSDTGSVRFTVEYEVLPVRFPDLYRSSAAEAFDATPAGVFTPPRSSRTPADAEWFGRGLQRSGSIMRGVTIGSNRDASLTSGFRLQLAGELSSDVNVVAALTDENSPIQPEGTTQALREVDNVSIDLTGRTYGATLGDLVYERDRVRGGAFGTVQRKVQGASATARLRPAEGWEVETGGVAASSRGRFHSVRFQGGEGNQGPYRLTGRNGEQHIVVVAGSERVFVNGERMTRGEVEDYTIDYASGEVTFMSRRLITSASRIAVDFEYADRQFTRNLLGADVTARTADGGIRVRASVLQEADDPDHPIDAPLDDATRAVLARSGTDRLAASFSGIQFAGIDSATGRGKGQYLLADTVIAGRTLSIVRYAPGDPLAFYTVTFSPVDAVPPDSAGYIRVSSGEYRFAGLGTGSYLPVRFIPIPQLHRFLNTQAEIALGGGVSLSADLAGSVNDGNRLSAVDDIGRAGDAHRLELSFAPRDPSIAGVRLVAIEASVLQRTVGASFIAPDRIDPVEYERRWDLPDIRTTGERLREGKLTVSPDSSVTGSVTIGELVRTGSVQATRSAVSASWAPSSGPRVEGEAERVGRTLLEPDQRSTWLRRQGGIVLPSTWGTPSIRIASEDRQETAGGSDSVLAGGFRYLEIMPRYESPVVSGTRISAELQVRAQDSSFAGSLERAYRAITQSYVAEARPVGWVSSMLNVSLRQTDFTEPFRLRGNGDARTILVRTQTRLSPWNRAADADLLYEFSNQRSARMERAFLRVAKGSGNYQYLGDTNGNGIADEAEFTPVRFDGDYVVIVVPGEQLVPVNDVKASMRLRLQPSRASLPEWVRWFSTETYARVEERSLDPDASNVYGLRVGSFLRQATTLAGAQLLTQDLLYRENDPVLSARVRVQERRGLTQFIAAPERTYANERSIRLRVQLGREIANQTDVGVRRDRLLAGGLSPRERDVALTTGTTDFTYRIERQWEAGWTLGIGRGTDNLKGSGAVADMNDQSVRLVYGIPGRGQVRAELHREEVIVAEATSSKPVPFELTEGKVPGKSWLWQITAEYRVSTLLQVSVSYAGRREGARPVVHTARAEARAFF